MRHEALVQASRDRGVPRTRGEIKRALPRALMMAHGHDFGSPFLSHTKSICVLSRSQTYVAGHRRAGLTGSRTGVDFRSAENCNGPRTRSVPAVEPT